MTNVSNNYQADYANALGTAVVGGSAWGIGQYIFNKRPFIDSKGNMKDSFVKNMEESLIAIKDSPTLENIEFQKNLEKEIDKLKTHDEIKEVLNKRKNEFMRINDDEIKLINDEISKMEITDSKNFIKNLFKTDGKYQKYYKETLDSCYETGKLKHNSTKFSNEKFDALKKVIQKARRDSALKAAGIFMGVCAGCCCFFEWWSSRKK